jgi:hypothetical protein
MIVRLAEPGPQLAEQGQRQIPPQMISTLASIAAELDLLYLVFHQDLQVLSAERNLEFPINLQLPAPILKSRVIILCLPPLQVN